jgi:hypothetical protein
MKTGEIIHKFELEDESYCCQLTDTGIWTTDDSYILKHWNFKSNTQARSSR